jgi:hypothetical protein
VTDVLIRRVPRGTSKEREIGVLDFLDDAVAMSIVNFTNFRQMNFPGRSLQKSYAQSIFKLCETAANVGFRQLQSPRRCRHTAVRQCQTKMA